MDKKPKRLSINTVEINAKNIEKQRTKYERGVKSKHTEKL